VGNAAGHKGGGGVHESWARLGSKNTSVAEEFGRYSGVYRDVIVMRGRFSEKKI